MNIIHSDIFPYILCLLGACVSVITTKSLQRRKIGTFKEIANDIIHKAEIDVEAKMDNASLEIKKKEIELQREMEELLQHEKSKISIEEERLKRREEKHEMRVNLVEKKLLHLEKRETTLSQEREAFEKREENLREQKQQVISELETLAQLTPDAARTILLDKISNTVTADAAKRTKQIIEDATQNAEKQSIQIIATAINRLSVPHVSEATITTITLPNEDIKGRIIGREGRNIRSFEHITGVNLIIDDTPGVVVLSSFDPVRKLIAKHALSELVLDSRIHPSRIEEVYERSKTTVHAQIKEYGEDASLSLGIMDLQQELVNLLGTLKLRYSYGQNLLNHSLEVAHLLGFMAAELGLDVPLAKRIGLLHDIGKALSHEYEGSHAAVGSTVAQRYGESPDVVNGIACHHEEISPATIEGSLCSAADALSAARPGARVEAVEQYIKRLRDLETIAMHFPGIKSAHAMQAGREIRVIVSPDMIDDAGSLNLARDIAQKIESDLSYAGKIKVTVIREKRSVEYAV